MKWGQWLDMIIVTESPLNLKTVILLCTKVSHQMDFEWSNVYHFNARASNLRTSRFICNSAEKFPLKTSHRSQTGRYITFYCQDATRGENTLYWLNISRRNGCSLTDKCVNVSVTCIAVYKMMSNSSAIRIFWPISKLFANISPNNNCGILWYDMPLHSDIFIEYV